jgi:hypothetical protein
MDGPAIIRAGDFGLACRAASGITLQTLRLRGHRRELAHGRGQVARGTPVLRQLTDNNLATRENPENGQPPHHHR